jgi:hypothetical protein
VLLFQPLHLVYKAGIIALFVLLNILLSTVSVDDLNLVLPEAMTRRISALLSRRGGEAVSHGN